MFSTTADVTAAQRAERGDDPAEEDDGCVGRVLLDPGVVERQQFVAGRGQPHDTGLVDGAVLVDVAAGKLEVELRAERLPVSVRSAALDVRPGVPSGSGSTAAPWVRCIMRWWIRRSR